MKTETRTRDGKDEHKHVGYEWWHPVTRVHDASIINDILTEEGFFWLNVNREVEDVKKQMIYYEQRVIASETITRRLMWMKYIMTLVSWGFVPNYFHGGVK
jgi:endonuclease III-like uncharacterized protein